MGKIFNYKNKGFW